MSTNNIEKDYTSSNNQDSDWLEKYYKSKQYNKNRVMIEIIFEVIIMVIFLIISLLNGHKYNLTFIIFCILCFITVIAECRILAKAGMEWWYIFIPGYNLYCLFKIALGEGLYVLLTLIPIVNVVILFMFWYKLAKSFGKSTLFSVLSMFFGIITIQIIAFDDSKYLKH